MSESTVQPRSAFGRFQLSNNGYRPAKGEAILNRRAIVDRDRAGCPIGRADSTARRKLELPNGKQTLRD